MSPTGRIQTGQHALSARLAFARESEDARCRCCGELRRRLARGTPRAVDEIGACTRYDSGAEVRRQNLMQPGLAHPHVLISRRCHSIFKVTLDKRENDRADYLLGAFNWHIDGSMDDVPVRASLLNARRLSPTGGDTEFANTYAAYDDLPASEQRSLEALRVVHTIQAVQRLVYPNPTPEQVESWSGYKPKVHPLVWRHESGRRSLLIGSTASHIEGMSEPDGRALLARLEAWATQPEFVYRHRWKLGDLLIWDNTGTMHRVTPYALDSGRMMHRTTLVGEERVA